MVWCRGHPITSCHQREGLSNDDYLCVDADAAGRRGARRGCVPLARLGKAQCWHRMARKNPRGTGKTFWHDEDWGQCEASLSSGNLDLSAAAFAINVVPHK